MNKLEFARQCFGNFFTRGKWAKEILPIQEIEESISCIARTDKTRLFPIQTERGYPKPYPLQIPWSVAEKAYGVYASRYGKSQTLEHLADRGGFGPGEMDMFHPTWLEEVSEITNLNSTIEILVIALKQAHNCATLKPDGTCDGCPVSEALRKVNDD